MTSDELSAEPTSAELSDAELSNDSAERRRSYSRLTDVVQLSEMESYLDITIGETRPVIITRRIATRVAATTNALDFDPFVTRPPRRTVLWTDADPLVAHKRAATTLLATLRSYPRFAPWKLALGAPDISHSPSLVVWPLIIG